MISLRKKLKLYLLNIKEDKEPDIKPKHKPKKKVRKEKMPARLKKGDKK